MTGKTTFAQGQLRTLIERIERLEEEKKTISGDIREVYAEAKANGFDTKILRMVISLRKKDANERQEEEAMLDVYLSAIGMQPGLFDRAEQIEPQPPAAPQTVERGGGLDASPGAPAASIQEQAPGVSPAGASKPLTSDYETPEAVSSGVTGLLAANSGDLAQSEQPQASSHDLPAAQVAGHFPPLMPPPPILLTWQFPPFLTGGQLRRGQGDGKDYR